MFLSNNDKFKDKSMSLHKCIFFTSYVRFGVNIPEGSVATKSSDGMQPTLGFGRRQVGRVINESTSWKLNGKE